MKNIFFLGSPEITNSKFRTCPVARGGRRRLPQWAWIAITIGTALLLLVIAGVIFAFIRKSKSNGGSTTKTYSAKSHKKEPRQTEDKGEHNSLII